MAEPRKIKAKELLADIRQGLDDAALLAKYQIPPETLHRFLTQLVEAGLLKQAEIDQRTAQAAQPEPLFTESDQVAQSKPLQPEQIFIQPTPVEPEQPAETAPPSESIEPPPLPPKQPRSSPFINCPACGRRTLSSNISCRHCGHKLGSGVSSRSPGGVRSDRRGARPGSQSFSTNGAFKFGWDTMKQHFWFFVLLLLILLAVDLFPDIAFGGLRRLIPASEYIINFVSWVLNLVVQMGFIKITLKFCDDEKGDFGDLFSCTSMLLNYAIGSILYMLIVIGGFVLLIVPGIIWSIKFQFFGYFIVDKQLGPIEALKESSQITTGVKSRLFGFDALMGAINILGFLCLVLGLFATIPMTAVAAAFVYRSLEDPEFVDRNEYARIPSGNFAPIIAIVLIVVFVFGILAAIAVPNLLVAIQRSKVSRTKADMRAIGTALGSFWVDTNTYPKTSYIVPFSQVDLPNNYYEGTVQDAWEREFRYISDGTTYLLTSYGKDGTEGGTRFDADIVYSDKHRFVSPEHADP